jgi:biotin carboxyl carrier protein
MIEIQAEMDATVWQMLVVAGQSVLEDDEVIILESMKMEIPVIAPSAGTVKSVQVSVGEAVKRGQTLITLDTD